MKRLRLAGVGCGSRTSTSMQLASTMPDRFEIVGAADPIPWKVDRIARLSKYPDFKRFNTAAELLAQDKFADVLIIGTQDQYHVEPCMPALDRGYDAFSKSPSPPPRKTSSNSKPSPNPSAAESSFLCALSVHRGHREHRGRKKG